MNKTYSVEVVESGSGHETIISYVVVGVNKLEICRCVLASQAGFICELLNKHAS